MLFSFCKFNDLRMYMLNLFVENYDSLVAI